MLHLFFLKKIKKSIDKHTKLAYNVLVKTSRMYPFSPYGEGFAVNITISLGGKLYIFAADIFIRFFICRSSENFKEGFA